MSVALLLLCMLVQSSQASSWPVIPKEELELADGAAGPGAPAILLYREVVTYDAKALETEYRRIKILTDAGKKYADIEIPYFEKQVKIEDIRARTTRPDGTSTEFQGQIFDRVVVKGRKVKVQVKAFTLPDIQKGSIIEYSYTARFRQKPPDVLKNPKDYIIRETLVYPAADWTIQEELFTRRARFVVYPFKNAPFYWAMRSLPKSLEPSRQQDGSSVVEVQDVAGFQEEDLMPPKNYLRSRLTCFYVLGFPVSGVFWDSEASNSAKALKSFMGDPQKLKSVIATVFSEQDPPETRLWKLYSRVQKIRYLSYEPSKSDKELERENIKENKNVEDVLKRDYAFANEINLVLVALARAAGFESAPMMVTSRDSNFFDSSLPLLSQLDAMVVWVRAGGKDYFLDPATRFCPFDLLPWAESATRGIVITDGLFPFAKSVDPKYKSIASTPWPTSNGAVVKTAAILQMDPDGSVNGSVVANFAGQEALDRRRVWLEKPCGQKMEGEARQQAAQMTAVTNQRILEKNKALLRLTAIPLSWVVRAEMPRGNYDNIDQYFNQIIREDRFRIILLA